MNRSLLIGCLGTLLGSAGLAADASAPQARQGPFLQRHEAYLQRGRSGPIGLLFLGDSITEHWNNVPWIWDHFYGADQPANFGSSGDTTGNVIWRIEHGELDGIKPRVVVLLIGTNNTATDSADAIAAAEAKIVGMIRERIPDARVLLLAIFPRGPRNLAGGKPDDDVGRMKVIRAVNERLARLDDGKHVRFLDIGAKFLGDDGSISRSILSDRLHPTAAGYEIWASAMQPLLRKLWEPEVVRP